MSDSNKVAPNFFRAFWESISNLEFYRVAAALPLARVFSYLLFLSLLIALLTTALLAPGLYRDLDKLISFIQNELPPITIENGEALVQAPQPIDKELMGRHFIIDTTGKITGIAPQYPNALMITRNTVIVKENGQEKAYALSQMKGKVVINGRGLTKHRILLWVGILFSMFLFNVVSLFATRLILVFLFSLCGIVAAALFKLGLPYVKIFIVGGYAITPFFLLETLMRLFYYYSKFTFLLLYAVYGLFLIYIFRTFPNVKERTDNPSESAGN